MASDNDYQSSNFAQILHLHGADARAFASTQLASNVEQLEVGSWQWTAWLDATGKVRMLGMLWPAADGDGLSILLRGGNAQRLCAAMQPYVLRAKVDLESTSPARLLPGDPLPHGELIRDGKDTLFGMGNYSLHLTPARADAGQPAERPCIDAAIAAGHPWLPAPALDTLLPPALGLHRLGAVTLGKGCYPGQEMVNRLHRRGGHKFSMVHIRTGRAWSEGEDLVIDGRKLGIVLQRSGTAAQVVARQGTLDNLQDVWVERVFSD